MALSLFPEVVEVVVCFHYGSIFNLKILS